MSFELEVCVDQIEHALAAARAGATRIEMNQALSLDGLTPSIGECEWLVENCSIPVLAMLRPHNRDFCYGLAEQACLLRDCELLLQTGIAGIVFGALRTDGTLDTHTIRKIVQLCGDREIVVHRAFDRLQDQEAALGELIHLGVTRVLTSGGARTATEGAGRLQDLRKLAGEQLEILPGGGICSANLSFLLETTGCNQFHGSFSGGGSAPNCEDIRQARAILDRQSFG